MVTFTVLILLLIFLITNMNKNQNETVPLAPVGMIETIRKMGGPNKPWFMLEMSKQLKSNIFRLNLPISGGFYCVGCPTTNRAIQLDEKTNKAVNIYKSLNTIVGYENMHSRSNGPEWHNARKGLSRAFSSKEINRMKHICSKHADKWIEETLEPCIKNNETFDPSAEMVNISFRVILEAGFEYIVSDDECRQFKHHMKIALVEFALKRTSNPLRKFYAPLLSDYRNALISIKEIQAFGKKVLDIYRKNPNKSENNTIIRMIVENESFTSDTQRVAEIIIMIVGGHDTTGYTMSTTLVLLAKHPEIANKLQRELLSLELSQRAHSQYLKNVISESQRLLPVAPGGSARITGRDIVCKDGAMIIPKGSICLLAQIIFHRNERVFKDPERYHPERWETVNESMRHSFCPFAIGLRNCVGQSLAIPELCCVLSRLVANYSFEVETEGKFEFFLTLKYVGTRLKPSRVE